MDERRQAALMTMLVMFEQDGWKELSRELAEELENIRGRVLKTRASDDIFRMQGRADQIELMLYLPETVENMLAPEREEEDATV